MRVPDEMRAILRESGGLTPQLWARTERLFAAIGEFDSAAALERGLARTAIRLEHLARHIRQECLWHTSLLPPASGEETVRDMENRLLRQLWQEHRHLGVEEFCERFHISRPSFYRRLGEFGRHVHGFTIAGRQGLGYNARSKSSGGSVKPAAPGFLKNRAAHRAAASRAILHPLPTSERKEIA